MIEREAQAILSRHWNGNVPVDVEAIAARMGVEVLRGDLGAISGQVRTTDDGRTVVTINPNESRVRQRFTLAHELGHVALGHLRGRSQLLRDDSNTFRMSAGPQEREANAFAAALLMPADAVRYALQNGMAKTLDDMARLFRVSKAAMYWRVNNLGLFDGL